MKKKRQELPKLFSCGYEFNPGSAISPIDGRYNKKTQELSHHFSESALMRYRLLVEVEYLIFFSEEAKKIRLITDDEKHFLRSLYCYFDYVKFAKIKEWEKTTNHDVNAVVRWLIEQLKSSSLSDLVRFEHFGLTSEDVNNTAFALMLRGGIETLMDQYKSVLKSMLELTISGTKMPMLPHTHGQPASPTEVGWEINVFYERLNRIVKRIKEFSLLVKFGGATGGHNALYVAYPDIDWRKFSRVFIEEVLNSVIFINNLSLLDDKRRENFVAFQYNYYTTQIESHDTYAQLFDILKEANTVLLDFCKDMWTYISREYFTQKPIAGEDGSSAMPNKVNPIDFENAEGNLGIATALLEFFARELPISREQRHLSDSTIIRNFGTAFAHILISLQSLQKGLGKVYINTKGLEKDLEDHYEVIAEAYQIILRREGVTEAYDLLKGITREKKVTKELLHSFVDQAAEKYKLSEKVVAELKHITPHNYIGNRSID